MASVRWIEANFAKDFPPVMKAFNYTQNRPGGGVPARFDNRPNSLIVNWMSTLKGIRNLTVAATFFLSAGCGSTAESQGVPTHAVFDSAGSTRVSPGLVIVQDPPFTNAAPAPTVEKTE